MEFYDASASHSDEQSDGSAALDALQRTGMERSLDQALLDMDDLLARLDEEDAEEGAPPEVVPLLEAITGADGAPLTYASLHRRVHAGTTTWDTLWRHPEKEADGMRLLREVMARGRVALTEGIGAVDDREPRVAR